MKKNIEELQALADEYLETEMEVRKLADKLTVMECMGKAGDFSDGLSHMLDWFTNERIAVLIEIAEEESKQLAEV